MRMAFAFRLRPLTFAVDRGGARVLLVGRCLLLDVLAAPAAVYSDFTVDLTPAAARASAPTFSNPG